MKLIPGTVSISLSATGMILAGLFLSLLMAEIEATSQNRDGRNRLRKSSETTEEHPVPYFRSSQSVQKAKIHETVKFECNVANLGKNIITWHNVSSGRIIFAGPVNMFQDERLRIEDGGRVLHIQDISEFDSGSYKCQVEVKLNPIFLEHHLNVLVPPRVFPSPPDGNYVVRSGNDIELICHAEGSPRPVITWRRKVGNKGKLPSGEETLQTPILSIPSVERFDAGIYECTAENEVGHPASAELNLQVIYAPIVKLKDKKVYANPGQDEAILECFVYGEPFPEVYWKHQTNGQRPSNSPQSRLFTKMEGNRSILKIRNIDERDYGTYECAASNNEGTDVGEVELTGEPHQPDVLSPEDSPSKLSYTLQWSVKSPYKILQQKVNYWELKPPASHSPHQTREEQRNELHLHSHEQHRLTQARIIENGLFPETNKYVYEVNIPDLKADRTYVVQVKATNKFHEGIWSEKFLFRTSGKGSHLPMPPMEMWVLDPESRIIDTRSTLDGCCFSGFSPLDARVLNRQIIIINRCATSLRDVSMSTRDEHRPNPNTMGKVHGHSVRGKSGLTSPGTRTECSPQLWLIVPLVLMFTFLTPVIPQ